jgi:hypothetical protein
LLTRLNLEDNAKISPGLQNDIGFVLASRRALKCFCKRLCKPLDKKYMSFVIHGVQMSSICQENRELGQSQETTAGPIFLLVRASYSVE